MANFLLGQQITIRANDFIMKDLNAFIIKIDTNDNKLLLKLNKPLIHKNTSYQYVVASSRLSKGNINVLESKSLGCSVIWVPQEEYNANDPLALSWWRGGASAITDLYITACK